MTDLDVWGKMASYVDGGSDFDKFFTEQNKSGALDREEQQRNWDYLVAWKEQHPGLAVAMPTD